MAVLQNTARNFNEMKQTNLKKKGVWCNLLWKKAMDRWQRKEEEAMYCMAVLQKLLGSVSLLQKPVESTRLQKKIEMYCNHLGQSYEEFSR